MELRQLRYFVVLAEELHFRRAAERLFITAPTLSQQIRVLERELGGPLLVREPRVELTAAGETLVRTGRAVLAAAETAVRETRRASTDGAQVVRFGLLNGAPAWLPARFEALAGAVGARLVLTGGTTADQLRMLAADEVDLALVRGPLEIPEQFTARPIASEGLGLVMSARHLLAGHAEITPELLDDHELVLFARDSAPGLHRALLAELAARGARIRLSDSAMGHAQLLAVLPHRTDLVGLSSDRVRDHPGLAWRPLRDGPIPVDYVAVWRAASGHPIHAAVAETTAAGRWRAPM
ncbi:MULTISPECIES: LysR family transcriptional regulator [unclassified Nocardia]|uniref:LysR family transcriptional regulator n=1 Tax=unclassified Nocardia TaxID=2637762 RepID=UPI0033BA9A36